MAFAETIMLELIKYYCDEARPPLEGSPLYRELMLNVSSPAYTKKKKEKKLIIVVTDQF